MTFNKPTDSFYSYAALLASPVVVGLMMSGEAPGESWLDKLLKTLGQAAMWPFRTSQAVIETIAAAPYNIGQAAINWDVDIPYEYSNADENQILPESLQPFGFLNPAGSLGDFNEQYNAEVYQDLMNYYNGTGYYNSDRYQAYLNALGE